MEYNTPDGFNLATFMTTCATGLVPLQVDDTHPTADGFIVKVGNILTATLYTPDAAKDAVITAAVVAQGGTPT
jgi:hypothetical protein